MTSTPDKFQFGLPESKNPAGEVPPQKFVTFAVADQRFAVDILSVREIRIWTGATRLPNARRHVRGVINLRGAIIPVIDLALLFAVNRQEAPQKQVTVIVDVGNTLKGLLVDGVSDIVTVAHEAITALPSSETDGRKPMFSGLITSDEGLVAILSLQDLDLAEHPISTADAAVA